MFQQAQKEYHHRILLKPTKPVQASNNFMKPLTLKYQKYQSHHIIQLGLRTYVVFYRHILKYLAEQDVKFKYILYSNFFFFFFK